jgi:hypothetical protein
VATQTGGGDRLINLGDPLIKIWDLVKASGPFGLVTFELEVRPQPDELEDVVSGGFDRDGGFGVEVAAFADLLDTPPAAPFRAGFAFGGEGGAAGDFDDVGLPGLAVGAAQHDRSDTHAVPFGDEFERVDGTRV